MKRIFALLMAGMVSITTLSATEGQEEIRITPPDFARLTFGEGQPVPALPADVELLDGIEPSTLAPIGNQIWVFKIPRFRYYFMFPMTVLFWWDWYSPKPHKSGHEKRGSIQIFVG